MVPWWAADVCQRVDLQEAVAALPHDHVAALRGALGGSTVNELSALLGIPAEAVVPMLRVGIAKLDRVLAELVAKP